MPSELVRVNNAHFLPNAVTYFGKLVVMAEPLAELMVSVQLTFVPFVPFARSDCFSQNLSGAVTATAVDGNFDGESGKTRPPAGILVGIVGNLDHRHRAEVQRISCGN